jgi:pimeloyl-ACP methyl ester carboxylesterase
MGYRSGAPKIPDLLGVVGHIRIPLMMLHGERDSIVPVRNAYRIHEHNPAADLRIYPRVGHGVEAMRAQLPQRLRADLRAHFSSMA